MAEVIALTSSILAIAGAATTALRVSASLRKVARSLETAGDDIEDFAINIRAFALIIKLGMSSLNRCAAKRSSSEVMRYLEDFEVLDQLAMSPVNVLNKHIPILVALMNDICVAPQLDINLRDKACTFLCHIAEGLPKKIIKVNPTQRCRLHCGV